MQNCRSFFFAVLLTVVAVCLPFSALAGRHRIQFEQVFNTGAYNMGITQDSDGFLWFTTSGGLIRYDGYQKLVFTEGPHGLTSNFVPSVYEDSEGLLWIVTLSGLDLYNKKDGSIKHFQPDKSKPGSIGSNIFNWAPKLVTEDPDGGIWIASKNGVYRYDKTKAAFQAFRAVPGDPESLGNNDVWTIMADKTGRIWMGTAAGLDVYDRRSKSFTHYRHRANQQNSLGKGIVYAIAQDSDGEIWVGTSEGGLERFQPKNGTFFSYTHNPADPTSLANNEVFSITEDNKGSLWLGRSFSHSVGLEEFDKKTGKFTLYTHEAKQPGTLSGNIILSCFQDKSGSLWVPDNTGPINKFDPFSNRFNLYTTDPNFPDTKGLSGLTSVYEDSRGDIWLGGQKGLTRLNHTTEKWQPITVNPNDPKSLWNTYAFSVLEDRQGEFWIATDDGYLSLYDRDKGVVIKRYLNPFVHNTARQIVEDRTNPNIFWFGVESYGLFSFNKKTGKFNRLNDTKKNPQILGNDYICALVQDNNNILWIQTQGGLYRYDPESGQFSSYKHDPKDPESISSNVINDIFIDKRGTYWVSTDLGLDRFDPTSGKFTAYGKANGFTTLVIRAIEEDSSGKLWLGSNDGLFAFDPVQKKVVAHYTTDDGLQGDSFSLYGCSALKEHDGKLWFVGLGGANSFYPGRIQHNDNAPPVYILNISQGGEELVPRLQTSKIKDISLSWRHNYFEFEYVGLNFSQPEKNQYKYILEGWDHGWYYAGNKRFGRYSGLTGGNYVLKVLAANNDGVWGTNPAILKIHVETPFWETWWFYTLLGFFIAGLFSIFYIVRIAQLQRFNRELEHAYHDVGIAEKKFRSIFENAVEGIFQVSPKGRLINANPAAATILGFASPTAMQQELVQVRDWVQCSNHAWIKLISRLIKNGAVFNHEMQVRRKTGETIWLAFNVRLIKDESGNIQYLDGLMEDITLRKKADEQLHQNQEFLEQLVYERTKRYQEINENLQKEIMERERVEEELLRARKLESIGVLAGGIAHDFNNLMTVILGNINLVQLQSEYKESPELNNAVQALNRAMDLTRKFITFSSGGDPVKKIHDIEKLTRSAVELALSGSNIQAVFPAEKNIRMVDIDTSLVSQAMYNIIENSKQAMQQGGTLEVDLSNLTKNGDKSTTDLPIAKGDYIMIRFRDQGKGIPPEHLPKIFDPYFTTAAKGTQKGKGLGLTIAYSIIKKHGGYIFAESVMEKGTSVRLLLPAAAESIKVNEAIPTPMASQENKKKILLMDDEKMLRDMAQMMLGAIGYEVTVAADGDAAVDLYTQALEMANPYDVVILDLTIPGGVGGKEVIKTLLQLDPGLKAIVSSGYADDPVVSNYRQYGFIDALSKPYNMQEMENMLSRVFSS